MTDFVTGYVVPAGTGLAGDPGLKASRRSTGGAVSVCGTSIGAGRPLQSMTGDAMSCRDRAAAAAHASHPGGQPRHELEAIAALLGYRSLDMTLRLVSQCAADTTGTKSP